MSDITCAASGLTISPGDSVRYILITECPYNNHVGVNQYWFPRTFPLKAIYDDYGLIEKVEDSLAKSLILEGFKLDVVERGIGDNAFHDLAVSKDMDLNQYIEALTEGRLLVSREAHEYKSTHKYKTEKGIPTLGRINKLLAKNNIRILKSICDGQNVQEGYLVDKIKHGVIRIRFNANGNNWGKDVQFLEPLLPLLKNYATVMVSDGFNNEAKILVMPKPGVKYSTVKTRKAPLRVNHMMIREDVWQKILTFNIESDLDNKKISIADVKQELFDCYNYIQNELAGDKFSSNKSAMMFLIEECVNKFPNVAFALYDKIPFTVGINYNWKMLNEKQLPFEEVKSLLEDIAEFIHVTTYMFFVNWYYRPSDYHGPQFSYLSKQIEYLKGMLDVVKANKKELKKKGWI